MNCEKFRECILEGLAGELPADAQAEFADHESACAGCRAEVARWRELESGLRAGWPMEDPGPLPVISLRRPAAAWWETGWRWFSMTSAALVTASLIALAVFRPSVRWDGSRFEVAFRGAAGSTRMAGAEPVTRRQVQEWVRAEMQQEAGEQNARAALSSGTLTAAANGPGAEQWGQVRSKLQLLDESQAYLWRQIQEQQVNLQSLWRTTSMQVKSPAQDHPGAQ